MLTSTVSSITVKIHRLIEMIENKGSATKRAAALAPRRDCRGTRPRCGQAPRTRYALRHRRRTCCRRRPRTSRWSLRHVPEYDTAVLMRRTVLPARVVEAVCSPAVRVWAGEGVLRRAEVCCWARGMRVRIRGGGSCRRRTWSNGTGKTPRKDKPVDGLVSGAARGPRGGGRAKR